MFGFFQQQPLNVFNLCNCLSVLYFSSLVAESTIPALNSNCQSVHANNVFVWLLCKQKHRLCCFSDKVATQDLFAAIRILGPVVLKHTCCSHKLLQVLPNQPGLKY